MTTIGWWLVQNGLTVLVAVPLVLLIARGLRRRPAEEHILWLLLMAKLMTPPLVAWPNGWFSIPSSIDKRAETPLVLTGLAELHRFDVAGPSSAEREPQIEVSADVSPGVAARMAPSSVVEPSRPAPWPVNAWGFDLLWVAWGVGALIYATRVIRQLRIQRRLVGGSQPAGPGLGEWVRREAARVGVRRAPLVRVSPSVASPVLACGGSPVLIWPEAWTARLRSETHRAALLHELAHLRRRDHWIVWLEALAGLVWWWNPVYWLLRQKLHETRELACDALILQETFGDRRAYAELLLALTRGGSPVDGPLAVAQAGFVSQHALKRRLKMVFDDRASGRVSPLGLVLAGCLGLGALPGWSWGQEDAKSKDGSTRPERVEAVLVEVRGPAGQQPSNAAAQPRPFIITHNVSGPDEGGVVLQRFDLGENEGTMIVRRLEKGSLSITIEKDGHKNVMVLSTVDGQTALERGGSQEPVAITARALPATGTLRAAQWQGQVHLSTGDPPMAVVPITAPAQHIETARLGALYPVGMTPTGRITPEVLAENVELATLNLEEKRVALELAKQDADGSPNPRTQASLRLAELAVRRAQIELERARRAQSSPDVIVPVVAPVAR